MKIESLFGLMRKKAQEEGLKFRPIPEYGDMMTIAQFKQAVDCGSFIDYDGHGTMQRRTRSAI